MHHDLVHGMMGRNEFEDQFNKNAGFTVELDATTDNRQVTITLKDLVSCPTDIVLFAQPRDSLCPFGELFRKEDNISTVHAVFRQMALEYWGDVILCIQSSH